MKKFLKNQIIPFLAIFFTLSIINLVFQIIQQYFIVIPRMIELTESIRDNMLSCEESYKLIASAYEAGCGNKIEMQIMTLVISILLSIAISLIITYNKKNKANI